MDKRMQLELGEYLPDKIPGFYGLSQIEKFAGGQSNPTYLLTADSGQYVLRKKPMGKLLKSAHAVDREYRVIKALQYSGVPVPRALYLSPEPSVIGEMFYVMSYEPGTIYWDPALPELTPQTRHAVYAGMNKVMACLHDIAPSEIGLDDFGRPGNYFERQIARWQQQYLESIDEPDPNMLRLVSWLNANSPQDDGQISLIHGDIRLDNFIFDPQTTEIKALLDWELSTLGHPLADLAYQCMQLRMPNSSALKGLGGLDRKALGIPSEEEYVGLYCQSRGIDKISDWSFYLCFSFFRFAAILQGVMRRAQQGNASSDKAAAYGELAPMLAAMAIEHLETNNQI
ncbi:phosphotransferase family protein [Shewanella corallii]|uniref:Phosphotransferase family protein n=1 Tax=Shewanella corallii TaxID=560080 RepID=A0ABT0NAN9_9GAMM|nr:phosphotransferase family protein [Shewanella corallii]MCL2915518.1 phosphotransferase family protein [Shewanella corallii]